MTDERRSVVLVTIDSLRADHCGYVDPSSDATPALDALADEGTAFRTAVAPGPSTPESMPAVLTGSYPSGPVDDAASRLARRRERIRRHMHARETLAGRFRRRGYATAGFSPNPYTSRYFGFDAGFDRYVDFVDGSRERLYDGILDGALGGAALSSVFPMRVLLNWVQREEVFKPWAAFYDEIAAWLRDRDGPYFLWVLLMDTHDPYLVPASYRSQSRRATYLANLRLWMQGHDPPFDARTRRRLRRAYRDAVRYADAFLARLRGDLPGDPLVCVHGDHGEAFGEHGTYGHHQRLYEENLRVPLVVGGGPDRRHESPFDLRSLPDHLASLAAGDDPGPPASPARARTFSGDRRAVRGDDWKYVAGPDGPALYDLAADPDERTDRRDRHPDLVSACDRLLASWRADGAERRRLAAGATELADREGP